MLKEQRTKFISNRVAELIMVERLRRMLKEIGVVVIDLKIQKLPMETKVSLEYFPMSKEYANKSELIAKIKDYATTELKLQNVNIEVFRTKNYILEPAVVASFIEEALQTNKPIRTIIYKYLYKIKEAGAIGGEIYVKGKLGARGAKARKIKAYFGFIPKAGDLRKYVKKINHQAVTKAGVVGVEVMITPPEVEPMLKPQQAQEIKKEIQIKPEKGEIEEQDF
ncbi:MAG: hypothetical protein N3C61_02440 [Candidatus Micrarchaeota archaeon]|nr:hypothetical protein [Candidatus Micrarchaeota archaeon]